ncbi:DUF4082 domain-containing protein [Microbacterium aurum]
MAQHTPQRKKNLRTALIGAFVAALLSVTIVPTAVSASQSTRETTRGNASATTIWGDSTPRDVYHEKERRSVELGTRFTATSTVTATAIRVYKTSPAPATFTGTLWSSSGKALATAAFKTSRGTGWQTATLSTPITLRAGSEYVVSYRAPAGAGFAVTRYFSGASVNPSLTVTKRNAGVFTYAGAATFPRHTWHSSQYWVDVVASAPDNAGRPAPSTEVTPTATPTATPTPTATTTPTPTPTATTTPTPTPTATSAPTPTTTPNTSAAGFPTAATTGVPAGWQPKRVITGDYTITGDGTVLEDVRITGGVLYVRGSNVTIRRVELVSARIVNEYAGVCYGGLNIEDTTILQGNQDVWQPVIQSGGYTATRVKLDGVSEGFRIAGKDVGCGPVVIQDSWANISPAQGCDRPGVDWHGDGLQGYWGVEVTLRNSVIMMGRTQYCQATAAFFYPNQNNTRATVENVLLSGGGYVFRLETPGSVEGLKVVDDAWEYGPVDVGNCSQVTWGSGNELVKINADGSLTSVASLRCEGW